MDRKPCDTPHQIIQFNMYIRRMLVVKVMDRIINQYYIYIYYYGVNTAGSTQRYHITGRLGEEERKEDKEK